MQCLVWVLSHRLVHGLHGAKTKVQDHVCRNDLHRSHPPRRHSDIPNPGSGERLLPERFTLQP